MTDHRQDDEAVPPPLPGSIPSVSPSEENEGGAASVGGGDPAALPSPPLPEAGVSLPPVGGNKELLGIASIVVGLLSLPIGGCCAFFCAPIGLVGLLGAIVGSVLGVMGMRKAAANGERSITAIVGLCLSILAGIVSLVWFLLIILGVALGVALGGIQ